MIEIIFSVEGEQQVITRLVEMPDMLLLRLRKMLPDLGEQVREAAAARAPKHHGAQSKASRKYGPLASAISANLKERGDALTEVVGVGKAFYGRFQETGLDVMRKPPRRRGIVGVRTRFSKTGTVLVSAKRGLMRRQGEEKPFRLPAHPFLAPAARALRERIVAGIREAAAEAIK